MAFPHPIPPLCRQTKISWPTGRGPIVPVRQPVAFEGAGDDRLVDGGLGVCGFVSHVAKRIELCSMIAPGNDEAFAGDPCGIGGSEKKRGRRDVLGLSNAAQGRL